jgi:hypothetical protein
MLKHRYEQLHPPLNGSPLLCGFALIVPVLLVLLTTTQLSAHAKVVRQDLSIQVAMGYQITDKPYYWVPVRISITNNGAPFAGKLSIKTFTGSPFKRNIAITSPWNFEQPVTIPGKAQKTLTLSAPFYLSSNIDALGFVATLFDAQGQIVTSQTTGQNLGILSGDLFIGTLSDTTNGFNSLNNVSLPHQLDSLTLSTLDASTFPDNSAILKNFDIIILDNFTTRTLSPAQLMTLQIWINQGGILIEAGGSDWQRTLGSLPATLLPVQITTTQTLPADTNLLPADSASIATPSDTAPAASNIPTPISISSATLRTSATLESQTLLSKGSTPLIVQKQEGQGVICYVAFDLTQDTLANWTGIEALWTTLLLHTLDDRTLIDFSKDNIIDNGPGQLLTLGGIVHLLVPIKLLEPGLILVLLLCYVAMLGPIRLLIIRGLKQPKQWAWHITLITILVFSPLSLSIAAYQKNTLLIDNTISLIQLTEDGSAAHILTYHGMLTPDPGPISLQLTQKSLILPLSSNQSAQAPLPGPTNDPQADIVVGENQTTLTLSDNQRSAFDPVLSQRDTQLSGALTAHLTLHTHSISGTITNTLATALSDVYLLLPNYFLRIGHIAAGETQQINLPLYAAPLGGGHILADALAKQGGLTTPYPSSYQEQTSFEQHMALLAALNGTGMSVPSCQGACNKNMLIDQNVLVEANAPLDDNQVNRSYDPLLLPGASATLIGWADQPIDGSNTISMNGKHPNGYHENFLQMPIALTINNALDTPIGSIMGNAIDPQSSQAQFMLPGIYGLSSTNLLFTFTLPGTTQTQPGNISINIPVQWQPLSGALLGDKSIQTSLYNWHTASWNGVPEHHGNVTIPDPTLYTGPNQQILLEITNPANTPGPLIFGKPSLTFSPSTPP